MATKVHMMLRSFVVLTWMRDTVELLKHVTLWNNIEWIVLMVWCGVVHSSWPSRAMWHMHAPTFDKWHKKKKVTLHILTHGVM